MNRRGVKRTSLVIAVCALVGALAGIAGSAAAPSSKSSSAQKQAKAHKQAKAQKQALRKQLRFFRHGVRRGFSLGFGGPMMMGPPGGPGGPGGVVHAQAVVPNRGGTGFITVTTDS